MGDSLRIKRRSLAAASCLALLALIGTFLVATPQRAQALSGAEFDPGYIISDAAFYDSNAMTEAEIQSFLVAKKSGLSTYRNSTESRSRLVSDSTGNVRCEAFTGGQGLLASTLIYRAQKACGISAKVILVTLEKEQGLIRNPAPTSGALDRAMGFACPDTAPCAPTTLGFGNQIYNGALQLNTYKAAKFARQPGVHSIQFYPTNPKWDCGASNVNIRNYATAALYNYTPYQPNESALANLFGSGDECASYGNRNFWVFYNSWFGSSIGPVNPIGALDTVTAAPGHLRVTGWAFDPNSSASIAVHVYVNGVGTAAVANTSRPDVDAAYGGVGMLHGYDVSVPVGSQGPQEACVFAINEGPGQNVLLGCKTVTALAGPPIGVFESASSAGGIISASGWALDPDTSSPIPVHVYVDSHGVAFSADKERPDIAAAFGGYGAAHGFSASVSAAPGLHTVCVYAINVAGEGGNPSLGCKVVNVSSGTPVGVIDSVQAVPGHFAVSGWALDPDAAAAIPVHIYVDSKGTAFLANKVRPDIANAFPGYGAEHGFSELLEATPGTHTICVYGINIAPPGQNPLLGCRSIAALSGSPVGTVDVLGGSPGAIALSGWVWDPDTTAATSVRVEVDGAPTVFLADLMRTDVGAAYPLYGAAHGYTLNIAATAGSHKVCVYGVNVGAGNDVLLGCKTVSS